MLFWRAWKRSTVNSHTWKVLEEPIQRQPESGVSQKHNTALGLELMNAEQIPHLTLRSLMNTESITAKIKNMTNKDELRLRKRGPYKREAEMYAVIKTILDIQASQLTLVSPREWWRGGTGGGMTMAKPPARCSWRKGTRAELWLAVEK